MGKKNSSTKQRSTARGKNTKRPRGMASAKRGTNNCQKRQASDASDENGSSDGSSDDGAEKTRTRSRKKAKHVVEDVIEDECASEQECEVGEDIAVDDGFSSDNEDEGHANESDKVSFLMSQSATRRQTSN
jgi:hypothetical protein